MRALEKSSDSLSYARIEIKCANISGKGSNNIMLALRVRLQLIHKR